MALAVLTGVASASGIRYTWKAQGGGFFDSFTQRPLDKATVYLFDAGVCSPSNLVETAKGGAALAGQPFVLAKELADGVIVSGDEFIYDGEAVGVVWSAYMATELEKDGKRYVYVSSEVEVMALDRGFPTDIAFNCQFAYASSVKDAKTHNGPGWYEVGVVSVMKTICPGKGSDEMEILATSEDTAVDLVKVVTPDAEIVSDADYAKYFKLTATPTTAGKFLVRAELDAEAIGLDKTVESFAAVLADLAQKGGATVTVEIECRPGLSYRVLSATAVSGTYAKGEATPLATGAKTEVKVDVPEGGKAFFKIEANAQPGDEFCL